MPTRPPRTWPDRSLLGQLRGRIRDALVGLGRPVTYRPLQTMIRQGEESRYALLLLSGCAKMVVNTEFGCDVLLAVVGTGDLCGETPELEHRRRFANFVACVPVHARLIRAPELVGFLARTPEVCLVLAEVVGERLRSARQRHAEFVSCPAPMRVARVLLDIACRYPESGIRLSQYEIASLAGVALGTAEKALYTLHQENTVRRGYRQIVVTDMARLRHFAGLPEENPY